MAGEPRELRQWFAARVERLRLSRGLDVETLAARSLHRPEEVEAILAGEADLGVTTAFLLAGALEIPPAALLEGISWEPDMKGGGRLLLDRDQVDPERPIEERRRG